MNPSNIFVGQCPTLSHQKATIFYLFGLTYKFEQLNLSKPGDIVNASIQVENCKLRKQIRKNAGKIIFKVF